ncbi:MAG: sulfatase [Pseudomonadales bacterium]|nr:sulfatase [Pseudomonadales bacterium]
MSDKRPNILWIYIEDQDPRYGCYGEPLVDTLNIDALADQGVVFERAYSPAPVCSPSRSAVITGSYAIRNGTHVQRSSRFPGEEIYLPTGTKTVPELFRDAGYFTFNRGKDDYNFAYDRSDLYSVGNNSKDPGANKGVQAGGGDWSECPADMPFFAQIQTNGGKNGYSLDAAADMLCKLGVENPTLVNPDDVTVPPQYPDLPEMRDLVAAQLSTMLISDIEVAQMVTHLKETGHWGNTVIFLISDHGAYFPRAKQMCYEEGLHIPLIVAAPGMDDLAETIPAGSRRNEQTALLDVAATSLELAGITVPEYMDSTSLFSGASREYIFSARDRCEWVVDRTRSVINERYHYIKNFMTDRPLAQINYRSVWPAFVKIQEMYDRGELTTAQALPYGPRPAEELYDLIEDPHELVNLAELPEHQQTLSILRGRVQDWIEDTDDKGQYPDDPAALKITKQQFGKMCIDPIFEDL